MLEKAVESGEVDSNYGFQDDGVYRVDLDNPKTEKTNAVEEQSADEVSVRNEPEASEEVREENKQESVEEPAKEIEKEEKEQPLESLELIEDPSLEITETKQEKQEEEKEEEKNEIAQEPIVDSVQTKEYPENIQKLVDFMEETNGTLEDYVNLNKDYSKMENTSLVYEYYKSSKPHLNNEDINFLMQKEFAYDEEVAEPSEVRAKQLAFKEELYKANQHFLNSKEKYYADLKLRKQNEVPAEYKEAIEFYNSKKEAEEEGEKLRKDFTNKTNKVFDNEFKGFDFKVGEKKFRFKVEDKEKIRNSQSDLKNFASLFMDKQNSFIEKPLDYHKAIFAGANADKIASHFYEQGRADAIKENVKNAKNIDMQPRVDNSVISTSAGSKVKVVSGNSSDKLRIKWNK